MLSFSGSLKVFVAVEACDMRKGFNGLHAVVTERLGEEPRAGALCVLQSAAHPDQNPVLGRNGFVGVDQAVGARDFFLAPERGAGDNQVEVDAAGAGDADRRSGFAWSQTATMVRARDIKNFARKFPHKV